MSQIKLAYNICTLARPSR